MPCLGAFGDWGLHKGAPGSVRHIYSSLCHWERLFCWQEKRPLARLEFGMNKFTKCPQKVLCESLEKAQREALSLRIPPLFYCVCQIVSGDIPLVVLQTHWLYFFGEASNFSRTMSGYLSGAAVRRAHAPIKALKQSQLTTVLWPNNSRHV